MLLKMLLLLNGHGHGIDAIVGQAGQLLPSHCDLLLLSQLVLMLELLVHVHGVDGVIHVHVIHPRRHGICIWCSAATIASRHSSRKPCWWLAWSVGHLRLLLQSTAGRLFEMGEF
jgi:hypothetical protein